MCINKYYVAIVSGGRLVDKEFNHIVVFLIHPLAVEVRVANGSPLLCWRGGGVIPRHHQAAQVVNIQSRHAWR